MKMLFFNVVFARSVIIIVCTVSADTSNIKPQAGHVFAKTLQSLIDRNENRVQAMTTLNKLERRGVGNTLRIGDNESEESSEENNLSDDDVVVFVLNRDPTLRSIENEGMVADNPSYFQEIVVASDDFETEPGNSIKFAKIPNILTRDNPSYRAQTIKNYNNIKSSDRMGLNGLNISKEQASTSRKNWRGSCDKKAKKMCTKACQEAVHRICRMYSCKGRMKRHLKKECKLTCKAKFTNKHN